MAPPFCNLHLHSENSVLDGLGKPALYVDKAKQRGDPFLAVTDHGTLSGGYEHYMACREAGIKPGLGIEFYFVPNAEKVKEEKSGERFHVVILAKNLDGYRTLVYLNDEAHKRFYYKPVIDRSVCEALAYEEAENLIVLSGCAGSILSRKALGEVPGSAAQELAWWRETFPNFYIELQHHNTHFDRKLNMRLLKLAERYKLPWVITNDPHYVDPEESCYHDALLCIQTNAKLDQEERFRFEGEGYHLRSRAEIVTAFRKYGEHVWKPGIAETARIAKSIDLKIPEWDNRSWHIPKYRHVPKGRTSFELLKHLALRGLDEKGLKGEREYVERTKYELAEIEKIPFFADFLLITREIIQWAVKNGIWVGPGRGSTAACLVGWLAGIHKVDSVKYKLLFERFLNPARPKMPDIDTDFSQARREEVVQHVMDEYGAENVMPVAAFQTLKIRGAFRKLATAMGMPFSDLKKFTDIMDRAWGRDDDDLDEEGEDHIRIEHLPEELVEAYPELVEYIEGVIGTKSAISRHASGMIIFDPNDPVRSLVPQMWVVSSKKFACQFDLKSAEKFGLMKQDLLGLRTGDTITEAVALINQTQGIKLDPDSWIPDDEEGDDEVYRMISNGHNAGVFQIEGSTLGQGILKIKPRRFEDIVIATALYRKGPILAGSDKRYLANKKLKTVQVLHESLIPILKDTLGEVAFQEQAMQICSEIAGFDQGLVADFLAAVRFKDEKMMRPLRSKFIKGCRTVTGINPRTAAQIWIMLENQASYSFNRSHALAYSLISYQTARLKCWWPLEFITALMRTVPPKDDKTRAKRQSYLAEAIDLGFKILPPDINLSEDRMTCDYEEDGKPWMRFGFTDIKGIGPSTAKKIIEARIETHVGFKSMKDVNELLTPALIASLDMAGTLVSCGGHPRDNQVLEDLLGWQFEDTMTPVRQKYANKVKLPGRGNSRVLLIGEIIQSTHRKTNSGKPYTDWKVRWAPSDVFTIRCWEDASEIWNTPKNSIVAVEGKYSQEFKNVSVNNPDNVRILKYAEEDS